MTLPGNKKLVCVGSYRLTGRRLGRGNFAKVEEAVHTVLKAKVALKVMNVSEIKEEYVVRNLHREAKLLSQLSHPCIARLYETMQSGSIYYMVTELVAGGDLCTFIKAQRSGKLDEKFTKLFAKQLVSALSHMHSLGIVHRDLKMENIMLNEAKTHLKIVDFGLSNFWSPDSPLHTHCGSPEYAAPELFLTGQLYGPEVDMWSLGVILYGMVMGQLPFLTSRDQRISSQDRRKHLLAQINRGLSTSHRKALGSFSIEFRGILARLLTPDPSKRMRVVDIIRHPWITDHGRKQLRIGALRELDTIWKNIIIQEIAKLMGVDIMRIEYSIRNEPYGIIGGMYNILAYRRMIRQTTITKDENINHRPITVHSSVVRSTTKQHILRPITTSVNEKRPTEQWDADLNGTPSRLRVVGTKGVSRTYNLRSAANKTNLEDSAHKCSHTNKNCNNTLPDQTINRQIKSEPLDNSSLTTNPNKTTVKRRKSHPVCNGKDPPNRKISEKNSLKLRSKLTRSNTQKKKPKTPDLPSNTEKKTLRNSKHSTTTANSHHTCCQHNSSAPVSKKLLNEPIARCIAGYVSNYIQLDVNKCKWIKDLTAYKPGNKNVNESTTKKTNAVRRNISEKSYRK